MSSASQNSPPQHSFSIARVLLVAVPLGILCGWLMHSYWPQRIEAQTRSESENVVLKQMLNTDTGPKSKLDDRFTDADGDLIADPPKDVAQQISPDTLIFSYIANPNADSERARWQSFADFLAKKTGKKVEVVSFRTVPEQLAALKNGKLHVTGLNTGTVETAVNTCGFVPVCVPAHDDGTFGYQMKMIVPAKSEIKSLADLKTHTIAFTDRSSNSGYKAAVFILKEEGLLPERDYNWRFSTDHLESIKRIGIGEYEAAPVASDLLQGAIVRGEVTNADFRVIKESERFPPAALGYVYNLSPGLASEIRAAFLNFPIADPELKKQFSDSTRFVPVSFKNDFDLIRRIDDAVKSAPDASVIKELDSAPDDESTPAAAASAG
jgi:phosphonate transport system substrate-binding protein